DKIKVIKGLNSHIESIIECKSQLLVRLQQPFVGDFIKLEAQYHKFAGALFPQIAPLLADLNTHLENISWTKNLTFSDGKLEIMLSELNSILATLQTNFQSLCQMRGSMGSLYQHDSQTVPH
ncbi:AUGMIN subunit 2-like, partial [Mizuhopecten yessoensis]|uniref:AUGMIN subunit 2-like n=1 Tax=Mizuhopecten yessoensis TaxID=6573 RepID=UPI000B457F52